MRWVDNLRRSRPRRGHVEVSCTGLVHEILVFGELVDGAAMDARLQSTGPSVRRLHLNLLKNTHQIEKYAFASARLRSTYLVFLVNNHHFFILHHFLNLRCFGCAGLLDRLLEKCSAAGLGLHFGILLGLRIFLAIVCLLDGGFSHNSHLNDNTL